jgi:hypothetical protein
MCETWCIPPQAIFSTEPSTLPKHGLLSQVELYWQTTSIKPCWQTWSQLTGLVHQYSVLSSASNLLLSYCPLDFAVMHSMHKGENTTLTSCCRDMFMYQTYLKGITIPKQWVKHRINDRNTTLTKVAPTFNLCSNIEATDAQSLCCPLTIGPNMGNLCVFTTLRKFPCSACCQTWL